MRCPTMLFLSALLACAVPAAAQDDPLADRPDGVYRLSYPVRDGVWGDGGRRIVTTDEDGEREGWWDADMTRGPARMEVRLADGRVRDLDLRIGGPARRLREGAVDLGEIDPRIAADLLMGLVAGAEERIAEEALLGAVIARDAVVWPALVEVARDRSRPEEIRSDALFWIARDAADAAVGPLSELVDAEDESVEFREHAVFAISQLPERTALPLLLDIARAHKHPEVQRAAFIWLAEFDDPSVLELFETILVER